MKKVQRITIIKTKVKKRRDASDVAHPVEHLASECPDKEKGPKCFKCNNFGHIAAKCEESDKINTKKDNKVSERDYASGNR